MSMQRNLTQGPDLMNDSLAGLTWHRMTSQLHMTLYHSNVREFILFVAKQYTGMTGLKGPAAKTATKSVHVVMGLWK